MDWMIMPLTSALPGVGGDARSALSARRSRSSLSHALERHEKIRHHWASSHDDYHATAAALVAHLGASAGSEVADLGCGTGVSAVAVTRATGTGGTVYAIDTSAEMIAFAPRGVLDPVLMGSTGALGLPGVLARSVAGTENRRHPRPATGASTRPSDRPGWPRPPGRH